LQTRDRGKCHAVPGGRDAALYVRQGGGVT
jgi:hypothetical protein